MEVVIDFEFLRERQNEIVVKKLAVAGQNLSELFRFESPYAMAALSSDENGLNWDDGHIPYHKCSQSSRRLWRILHTSTASGLRNANCCLTCWDFQFTTCEILIARIRAPLILNSVAVCPVTDSPTSVAQLNRAFCVHLAQESPAD
jgi:hypothetical protein